MADLSKVGLEELASSFDRRGYELFIEDRVPTKMSVEETIVSALVNRHERLVEGIPVLLTKNKIDYKRLRELIGKYRIWNEFGYLGKFTLKHLHNEELKDLVWYCYNRRKKHAKLSSLDDAFFKYSITPEQEKWNLIGAPPYSALERQYRRYCR